MTDEYYKKELEEAKQRNAPKEFLDRMEFLSKGNDVQKNIDKWVNGTMKCSHWFDSKKNKDIILHKAIQHGIQLALDIIKEKKLTEELEAHKTK